MFIKSVTDYDDPEDQVFDKTKITWFTVKANLSETKREQEEKAIAIKKQIASGIIQPNGLPAGITPQMLGMKPQPPKNIQQMLPQQRIQYLRQQQQLSPQQQLYSKFGIRK